jgi:hypothetical protein
MDSYSHRGLAGRCRPCHTDNRVGQRDCCGVSASFRMSGASSSPRTGRMTVPIGIAARPGAVRAGERPSSRDTDTRNRARVADQELEPSGPVTDIHEPGCARPGYGSPLRTAHTSAAAARCQHAGSHRQGSRMPGRSGTAATSATLAVARARGWRRAGSAGSSPLLPGTPSPAAHFVSAGTPNAGSPGSSAPPTRAPRSGPAAVPVCPGKSISS